MMTTPSKRRHQNNQGRVRESWDETGRVRRDSFEICGGIKESQEEQKLEIYISTTQRVMRSKLFIKKTAPFYLKLCYEGLPYKGVRPWSEMTLSCNITLARIGS